MRYAYCPNCGAAVQRQQSFCDSCGKSLSASAQPENYRVSESRIVLMSVLSFGLYLFYWFYLTWKQYRDHTRQKAYPVWHALTLFVPIYGYFRTHAHMRSYKELMDTRRVESSINPGQVVFWVVVLTVLSNVGILVGFDQITQAEAVALFTAAVVTVVITVGILVHVQGNLNRYWDSLADSPGVNARIGVGEVIVVVLGVLFWIDAFLTMVSTSYRTP